MTLSLHQGGVVMSSQIKHTVTKIHLLARYLTPEPWFSVVAPLLQFIPTASCKWHLSPLHVKTTRAWEGGPKEHSAKQKWQCETHSVRYVPELSTFSDLLCIVAHPPPSFFCCLRPPSHHSSSLTSVSLVTIPHWLWPSTPFWPYGNHGTGKITLTIIDFHENELVDLTEKHKLPFVSTSQLKLFWSYDHLKFARNVDSYTSIFLVLLVS